MALRDPELMAAAASAVGADALSSLFKEYPLVTVKQTTTYPSDTTYQPHQQPHGLEPHHTTEDADVHKMRH